DVGGVADADAPLLLDGLDLVRRAEHGLSPDQLPEERYGALEHDALAVPGFVEVVCCNYNICPDRGADETGPGRVLSEGGRMATKRYDAALKHLLDRYAADWAAYLLAHLGLPPPRRVESVETDLSTVSAAADKVLRLGGRVPWLLHLELQAGHDRSLGRRLLQYNVLLNGRHNLPVRTVLVLLSRKADRGHLTGALEQHTPDGRR